MMNRRQQRSEAAQNAADRRRREDEAPRLQDEVPTLTSLSLSLDERRPGAAGGGGGHIRRVVVERAPALFVVPCTAVGCTGGVHSVTPAVMRALHERAAKFDGDTPCDSCNCVLHHTGSAEYR